MKKTTRLLIGGAAAVLACLGSVLPATAQGPPAAPGPAVPAVAPPPALIGSAPEPCDHEATRKVPHAVLRPVPHTRICYDIKEEEFCKTCGARTPIISTKCPCHDKYAGHDAESPCTDGVKCGKVQTRKVLIKKLVVEERDEVQCVPVEVPAKWHGHTVKPGCPAGEAVPPVR